MANQRGGDTIAAELHDATKAFGPVQALNGVSLAVQQGETLALLGPNGAGKTTTLRCCLGHTKPDAGTIRLAGLPIPDRARDARVRVGVVPQFDTLDPDFTVTENLVVFGRYFGLSKREWRELMETLGRG